jgi:Zn-dependent peptidase ImmA (M78 family)
MKVNSDKLTDVFRKVKNLQEHMHKWCIAPAEPPIRIEDVQWAVQDMYGLKISKFEVSFPADFVRGVLERRGEKEARIYIRAGQEEEWRRFVTVKELSHLLIDEREDWSPEGANIISGLLEEHSAARKGEAKDVTAAIRSEALAELAAIEILYPFIFRQQDIADLKAEKHTVKKFVLEYGIPEFAILRALSNRYFTLCSDFWARANAVGEVVS